MTITIDERKMSFSRDISMSHNIMCTSVHWVGEDQQYHESGEKIDRNVEHVSLEVLKIFRINYKNKSRHPIFIFLYTYIRICNSHRKICTYDTGTYFSSRMLTEKYYLNVRTYV